MTALAPPGHDLRSTALYDLEIYPNYFLLCVRCYGPAEAGDGPTTHHIFRIGDRTAAKAVLCRKDVWMVGHNTQRYDDLMLLCWLSGANQEQLFELNQYLIPKIKPKNAKLCQWIQKNLAARDVKKFGKEEKVHTIAFDSPAAAAIEWGDRHIIDTFVLGEQQGSLKNAAIVLGIEDLVEAPVPFGQALTAEQIAEVDAYCWHDIEITDKLLRHYAKNLEIRSRFAAVGIEAAYRVGSAKLAELYLLTRHTQDIVGREARKACISRIKKAAEDFSEKLSSVAVLTAPYNFSFMDEGFSAFWAMIRDADLVYAGHTTANVDSTAAQEEGWDVAAWRKAEREPSAYALRGAPVPKGALILHDDRGNAYKFGIGGLHNDAPRGIWRAGAGKVLVNVDVKSYYPSLLARNRFAPRHFPQMAEIEGRLKAERLAYKDAGRSADADALKLVLNSAFGKMKDKYSALFDPRAHFSITVSGQLLLLRLIDLVHKFCPSSVLLNANTDGVCFHMDACEETALTAVCTEWERFSGVELETEHFSVWAQSTCNNYVARKTDGKLKSKGGDFKIYPGMMREVRRQAPATKKMIMACLLDGAHPYVTAARLLVEKPTDYLLSSNHSEKTVAVVGGERMPGRKSLRYVWAKNGAIMQTEGKTGLRIAAKGNRVQMVDDLRTWDSSSVDTEIYVEEAMMQVLRVVHPYRTTDLPVAVKRDIRKYFKEWHDGLPVSPKN